MSTTQIAVPDDIIAQSNAKKASYFLRLVDSMEVKTAEDYSYAAEEVRNLKTTAKAMDEDRLKFTGPLNTVLKMINERFQPHIKLLEQAESVIKGKMAGFQQAEQARIRAEQEAAERAAAAERRRLAEEAEAVRRKAEAEAAAVAKAEAERQAAARAEQDRLDREAAAARGKKAKAEAEARAAELAHQNAAAAARAQAEAEEKRERAAAEASALEQVAAVVIAAPVAQAAKAGGVSIPKTLDYEVTDLEGFVGFILDKRPDLLGLISLDGTKMRALIKLQGLATTMPGLRVFEKFGVTVR